MDRHSLNIVSILLAILMAVSPIGSLAMQTSVSNNYSSHCQDAGTEPLSLEDWNSDSSWCTMENCAQHCNSSLHCSSHAPIILTQLDAPGHPGGKGLVIDSTPNTHLSIHSSGLYRPPRA